MIDSFDVGLIIGGIAGIGISYVYSIVAAWWRTIHPQRVDWDPTIERIRRL